MKLKKLRTFLISILLLFAVGCLLFHGCSSLLLQWLYDDLGNRDWCITLQYGYTIQQINGSKILLIKDSWRDNTNIVISQSIEAYCCNERYIGVMCSNSSEKLFYIVDMHQSKLMGPFEDSEYKTVCIESKIANLNQWIYTSPRPSNALFTNGEAR